MIRLLEAGILAGTKLRTHKIRTGLTVGIAGLLFGLIVSVLVVTQGVFDSVNKFSEVGLNNRSILSVMHISSDIGFNEYANTRNQEFVNEVEAEHKALIQKKQVAAKKYSVPYDAASEDPSPIGIDPTTKERIVTDSGISSAATSAVASKRRASQPVSFSIEDYAKPYTSAIQKGSFLPIQPKDGTFQFMKNGEEDFKKDTTSQYMAQDGTQDPTLSILEGSISRPFVTSTSFDTSKGEIPVIIPVKDAEKLLNLKPLDEKATLRQQQDRLTYIRDHINDATTSFCYRNQASISLLATARAQQDAAAKSASNKNYVKPDITYTIPEPSECGAVTIATDTRTAAVKKAADNFTLYQKEIGTWEGEPMQQKITVRGVGISSDGPSTNSQWSIANMISGLLSSSLGYNTWSIPSDLLNQVPIQSKPAGVFGIDANDPMIAQYSRSYLVEFTDKEEARAALRQSANSNNTYVYPFGSGSLLVDEARTWLEKILLWALLGVSGVAVIIMTSIIGRTVADGRRESAVFRAIGASRGDIVRIYGVYTVLLSLRVVVFAAVMGLSFALVIQLLFGQDATLGAQLAYAASDTTLTFDLFSIKSWYLAIVAAVIMLAGIVASILPIILGSRRSPIRDMRNDT